MVMLVGEGGVPVTLNSVILEATGCAWLVFAKSSTARQKQGNGNIGYVL